MPGKVVEQSCRWGQGFCLLGTSIVEAASDHLAPSFKPWQSPGSAAALCGHCLVGPDDNSPPWELLSSIFCPQTSLPCRLHTICLCSDKFANLIFHFIFSILLPREAVGVWAQNSVSPIPLRACQETVPCAEHTQSYMSPKQKSQLQKGHVWHPTQKKGWCPWRGHKTQQRRGLGNSGAPVTKWSVRAGPCLPPSPLGHSVLLQHPDSTSPALRAPRKHKAQEKQGWCSTPLILN